jgi:hypothetical protein
MYLMFCSYVEWIQDHSVGVTGRYYEILLKSILKVTPWKTERNGDGPGSFPLTVFGFNSFEPSFYLHTQIVCEFCNMSRRSYTVNSDGNARVLAYALYRYNPT